LRENKSSTKKAFLNNTIDQIGARSTLNNPDKGKLNYRKVRKNSDGRSMNKRVEFSEILS